MQIDYKFIEGSVTLGFRTDFLFERARNGIVG